MFENLPVELLQYVFMLLSPCLDFPNVLRVCKRWHDVCKEVMKLRQYRCFSAFKLESPLKWIVPKVTSSGSSTHHMPSKRFGSTIVFRGSSIYVFGGATSMFTTFNDLWVYDLCTKNWKRLLGDGDLPTPRAHAKGGFIDDNLFLFGGCQSFHHPSRNYSGQINWLNDLCKFNTKRLCWSRVALKLADLDVIQSPPVNGGQSGCFLPASSQGDPSLLVLFGGISPQSGVCTNDVCLVCPDEGRWLQLTEEQNPIGPRPAGRCGHAVCPLDAFNMLVMFGNREPPTASNPPERNDPGLDQPHAEQDKSYQGQPAADIWILTRCNSNPGQDWRYTTWFWTKVHCPINVPGCPPVDFYHSVAIRLPYTGRINRSFDAATEQTEDLCPSPVSPQPIVNGQATTYTVLCISQSTEHLLEEAARQRRNWRQRSRSCSSDLRSPSGVTEPVGVVSGSPTLSSGSNREPLAAQILSTGGCSSPSSSSSRHSPTGQDISDATPTIHSTSVPAGRRSLDRRAKRLEALAAQERRLFGSRSNTPLDRIFQGSQSLTPDAALPEDGISDKNPLAIYCLSIRVTPPQNLPIPCPAPIGHATATWLLPKKQDYIDLLGGPHDCLGFSCTFGTGCLFLFGGLCESDEPVPNDHVVQNPGDLEASHPGPWRPINELPDANDSCVLRDSPFQSGSFKSNNPQLASFYVLQPRGLVGTVV